MFYILGRCSEIGLLKKTNMKVTEKAEFTSLYSVMRAELDKQKTQEHQNLDVFPHRDSYLHDIYFSWGYYLIMSDDQSDFLYPTFAKYAAKVNPSNEQTKSQVSTLWDRCFQTLLKLCEEYDDVHINKILTSHHGKKGSAQWLAENHTNPLGTIFRAGWELRTAHSIFDYVLGKQMLVSECGKTLAGWTNTFGNKVTGGIPPTTEIIAEKVKIDLFMSVLFRYHKNVEMDIQYMLVASIIKWYDNIESDIMLVEKFNGDLIVNHRFISKIKDTLKICGISNHEFREWRDLINDEYAKQNFASLPLQYLEQYVGKQNDARSIMVDPRTLLECNYNMCKTMQEMIVRDEQRSKRESRLEKRLYYMERSIHELKCLIIVS